MLVRLRRFLDVRPGEGRPVVYTFLYIATVVAAFLLAKPIRNGLFLTEFGARNLVYVYVGVPLVLSVFVPVYSRLVARRGQRVVTLGTLVFFCANALAFWYLLRYERAPWMSGAFYVWVNCFGIIAPVQAWSFANAVFDTRQARRLFGVIGGGASLGAILGGLLARVLVDFVGTVNLILVLAVMIAVAGVIVAAAWRERRGVARDLVAEPARVPFRQTCERIATTPYLRAIAAVVILVAVVTQWTQFQFSVMAEARFAGDTDRLTRFFGEFNFALGSVAFLLQLVATGPVLRRLGIGVAILTLPLSLGVGSLLIVLVPAMWTVVLTNAFDQSLRFSIDKATFELLYLPLPAGLRSQVKGTIDLLVNRLADGLGGFALGLMTQGFNLMAYQLPGLGFGIRGIAAVNLGLIACWALVALALRRGYVEEIQRSITEHRLGVQQASARVLDRDASEFLAGRLIAVRTEEILYALYLLEQAGGNVAHPAVRALLRHPQPDVRLRALALLDQAGDRAAAREVEELLRDPDLAVRTEAMLFLAHHAAIDPLERIEHLGDFADFSIRAGMVAFLARSGGEPNPDAAGAILDPMVAEDGPGGARTRLEAARLLGVLPPRYTFQLTRLLDDADPAVVRAAVEAAGRAHYAGVAPMLIARLAGPDGGSAIDALGRLGVGALPALESALRDVEVPPEVRREIPLALARIGTRGAQRLLTSCLLEPDAALRFNAISALNKQRQLHPELPLDSIALEMVLTAEVMGHYRSYQLLGSLSVELPAGDPAIGSLRSSMEQEVERIFRLMELLWPEYDMHGVYVGLRSESRAVRANATELLDNVLKPELRELVLPLIDAQIGEAERIRRAQRFFGGAVPTREEAVRALVSSEDPWLKASGAYAIGVLQLRALEPELDRHLESRDALLRETARAAKARLHPEAAAEAEPAAEGAFEPASAPESLGVG